MTKKNHAIEFYRILATMVICIHHMQGKCGVSIIKNGDLCVDIFFIISGLFLASTFIKEKEHSGSKFFIKRLERLYPEYIFAAVIAIVSYSVIGKFEISKAISELFLIQNSGIFRGGYNYPCWYVSTLIFASFVLYELLKYNKDLFVKVIAPILVVAGYTYILNNISHDFIWSVRGFIYTPMLRCFCGMTLGIFIRFLSQCDFVQNINKVIATAGECVCFVIVCIGMVTEVFNYAIVVLSAAVLIFLTYNKVGLVASKLLNFKGFSYISEYSYSVYLNHGIMANTLDTINKSYLNMGKSILLIYVAVVIVYSVVTHKAIKYIFDKLKNRKRIKN